MKRSKAGSKRTRATGTRKTGAGRKIRRAAARRDKPRLRTGGLRSHKAAGSRRGVARRQRRGRIGSGKGGGSYDAGFNKAYNEGYNVGFAKGFEDGHQIAYEQQL